MSKILVKVVFDIQDRGFVVAGEVIEGRIAKGMILHYCQNSKSINFEIIGSEIVDIDRQAGVAYPALVTNSKLVSENNLKSEAHWLGNVYECNWKIFAL